MLKIIDFYAVWCGPCQAFKPVWEKVSNEYSGNEEVEFLQVDVDTNRQMAMEYAISSIPTTVVVKDGKEVERYSGLMGEEQFRNFIKRHL